jgi:crotonobetainyl-CoA:carnitine CoA-transferase CaiB-like acyl-CoA transferase
MWMEREYVGRIPHPAAPYRLDGQVAEIASPAPTLGQHSRAVLAGLLGVSPAELDALEADGVIGTEPAIAVPA